MAAQPSADILVQNPCKIFDTFADNGATAGLVFGSRQVAPTGVDPRWVSALIYRIAEIEENGVAEGVLGQTHSGAPVLYAHNALGT